MTKENKDKDEEIRRSENPTEYEENQSGDKQKYYVDAYIYLQVIGEDRAEAELKAENKLDNGDFDDLTLEVIER